ncbi:MAG: hypothetical protein AAB623_00415 [Patescibacteria group bacterium]
MEKEITNKDLANLIGNLSVTTDNNTKSIKDLANLIGNLSVTTDNNTKSIDIIAKNTAYILDNMATKEDLLNLKQELKTDIYDFRTEFKSFKEDTNESIKKTEEDVIELSDTDMLHDKRIEKLENKVFA